MYYTPVIPEKLNFYLKGYDEIKRINLVQNFKKGFRIGYKASRNIVTISNNPRSASLNSKLLTDLINKEIEAKYILGPFNNIPFKYYICSGITGIPKKDGTLRFIHDLSKPPNMSVNDGILREDASVQYEGINDVIRLIKKFGRNSLFAKCDVKNAFRIIPISPLDYHLLLFQWNNKFYINSSLAMGCSTSCKIFESLSHGLQWIIQQKFADNVTHILDDFIFAGPKDSNLCEKSLQYFLYLCNDVNIPIKASKTINPTTLFEAHGYEIDTSLLQIRMPQDKILKAKNMILYLLSSEKVTLKTIQKVLGVLSFITNVIKPGRAFKRKLESLTINIPPRANPMIHLTQDVKNDLHIWLSFLTNFNGKIVISDNELSSIQIYTDASGSHGYAFILQNKWIYGKWPKSWENVSIHVKEIFPIFLGLKIFATQLTNKFVVLHCDNIAVVESMNKLTTKDSKMLTFMKEIALVILKHNISIKCVHIAGKENTVADRISRGFLQEAKQCNPKLMTSHVPIPADLHPSNWKI